MAIVKATASFRQEVGGTHIEILKGSLLSNSHSIVVANPKRFAKASEQDIKDAVEAARPRV